MGIRWNSDFHPKPAAARAAASESAATPPAPIRIRMAGSDGALSMNRTVITRGATALLLAFGLSACASSNSSSTRQVSYPVPDSPGIYAYTTKNDLRRIDGDANWEASTWPERANLPSNTRFVVNDPALTDRSPVGNVELWRVAWVRSEVNANNQAMPMAGTEWALAPVAPYSVPVRLETPSNKRGVVNVVPTAPLAPGLYAVRINEPGARQARVGVGWDSLDQRQYAAANCVDRYLGEAASIVLVPPWLRRSRWPLCRPVRCSTARASVIRRRPWSRCRVLRWSPPRP
jgi:hypothetical protein